MVNKSFKRLTKSIKRIIKSIKPLTNSFKRINIRASESSYRVKHCTLIQQFYYYY